MLSPRLLRDAAAFIVMLALAGHTAAGRVDDFVLLDEHGAAHQLHYYTHAQAVVLATHSTQAKESNALIAGLKNLQESVDAKLQIFLLNADPADTRTSAQRQRENLNVDFPVLLDDTQLVSKTLGAKKIGEVLLIDPQQWQLLYRGPLNEALSAALQQHLAGKTVAVAENAMPDTAPAIDYQFAKAGDEISYADSIAPLLKEKCASCHRPEGIGPWAMTGYEMIRGFAPMIKEVVLTKRMPPWHADPHINAFQEDLSLSVAQKQTLINWIDAGAPRGDGADPLAAVKAQTTDWELGEPDLIVELPAFDIPATGTLDYQFFEVANPLQKDVWVRAVQIVPGDRQVLHHAIATFGEPQNPGTITPASGSAGNVVTSSLLQQQLMTFVPGNETYIYPQETALKLPAGSSFFTQMHYTTSGRATTDTTRIGLYFRDTPPDYVLRHYAIINPDLNIQPMDRASEAKAYYTFRRDAVIYSLFPHAHYRGSRSRFDVRYPDGREETVLSVPNYNFNWQRYFKLAEPLKVPAGTLLIHTTVFDNSPQNASNPDPSKTVNFGLQSWEEMLYGGVSYRYAEDSMEHLEIEPLEFRASIAMGYLDQNLDGKLVLEEFPEQARGRLGELIPFFDQNKNDGLEYEELYNLYRATSRPMPQFSSQETGNGE